MSKVAICPKCGNDSFYTLNRHGQKINKMNEPLDPTTIEPSPRMGLKMRRRIFAARRRATDIQANDAAQATPRESKP